MALAVEDLPQDIRSALATDMTIDITTTGRQSGRPRRIEIWFLNIDDRIYITGTPGPRDWLANLRADPALTFHLKGSVQADLQATAVEVTDLDERRRVFRAASAQWYLNQGDGLTVLVDEAPMVRLTFTAID